MIEKFSVKFDGRFKITSTNQLPLKVLELLQRIQLGVTYIKCNLTMKENEFSVGKSKALYQINKKTFDYKNIREIFSFKQYDDCSIVLHYHKDELSLSYFQFENKSDKETFQSKIVSFKNDRTGNFVTVIDNNISINNTESIYETIIPYPDVYDEVIDNNNISVTDGRNKREKSFEDNQLNEITNDNFSVDIESKNDSENYEQSEIYQEMSNKCKYVSMLNYDENPASDFSLENITSQEKSNIFCQNNQDYEKCNTKKLNSLGDLSDLLIVNGSMYLSCTKFESSLIIFDSCDTIE